MAYGADAFRLQSPLLTHASPRLPAMWGPPRLSRPLITSCTHVLARLSDRLLFSCLLVGIHSLLVPLIVHEAAAPVREPNTAGRVPKLPLGRRR
jgi:hypothetical protein